MNHTQRTARIIIHQHTVHADNGGIAALGDVNVYRAEPCAQCEWRIVGEAGQRCRHCRTRGVVLVALLVWFVLLDGIALACAHAALGQDALFVGAAFAALVVFLVGRRWARHPGFYGDGV